MSLPRVHLVFGAHVIRDINSPRDPGTQFAAKTGEVFETLANSLGGKRKNQQVVVFVENSALYGLPSDYRSCCNFILEGADQLGLDKSDLFISLAEGGSPESFQRATRRIFDDVVRMYPREARTLEVERAYGTADPWRYAVGTTLGNLTRKLKIRSSARMEVISFETFFEDLRELAARYLADFFIQLGRPKEAITYIERELAAYQKASRRRDVITADNVADLYRRTGEETGILVVRGFGHRTNIHNLLRRDGRLNVPYLSHDVATHNIVPPIEIFYRNEPIGEERAREIFLQEAALRTISRADPQIEQLDRQLQLVSVVKSIGLDDLRDWLEQSESLGSGDAVLQALHRLINRN